MAGRTSCSGGAVEVDRDEAVELPLGKASNVMDGEFKGSRAVGCRCIVSLFSHRERAGCGARSFAYYILNIMASFSSL